MKEFSEASRPAPLSRIFSPKFVVPFLLLAALISGIFLDGRPLKKVTAMLDRYDQVDAIQLVTPDGEETVIRDMEPLASYKEALRPAVLSRAEKREIQSSIEKELAAVTYWIGEEKLAEATLYLLSEDCQASIALDTSYGKLVGKIFGQYFALHQPTP